MSTHSRFENLKVGRSSQEVRNFGKCKDAKFIRRSGHTANGKSTAQKRSQDPEEKE